MNKKHRQSSPSRRAKRQSGSKRAAGAGGSPHADFYAALQAKDLGTAFNEAVKLLARFPDHVMGHKAMARYAQATAQPELAVQHLQEAVGSADASFDDAYEMGLVARKASAPELAICFFRQALELEPKSKEVEGQLLVVYGLSGHWDDAVQSCDRLLDANPDDADVWRYRGHALFKLRRTEEALENAHRALELSPTLRDVNNNIALIYVNRGDYERASHHYKKELELYPDNEQPRLNLFLAQHYNPDYSADDLYDESLSWELHHAPDFPPQRPETPRDPNRRLRIGLLSGGFRGHPAGTMSVAGLRHLDPKDYSLYFYSTNDQSDDLSKIFHAIAYQWRSVSLYSNQALADLIRSDEIDILIDMNGPGDGCRYGALALRPAPLMVKWVGAQINTTGLSFMDYMLSDSIETPPGVDSHYTEKLIRLPDDYICYFPTSTPSQSSLAAVANGFITFGCLNNPAKINEQLISQWALLMAEVPHSRLLLRGAQFGEPDFCEDIRSRFSTLGVEPSRLLLEGPASHEEFLATYRRVDIALDTWPYSGGLTTCEALLMGVPVVTHVGPTFAGRHSATHLTNAGLPELVTDNWDDFHARVKELANDLPNLAVIRSSLRTVLLESPVCDGTRYAAHLSTALRRIWLRYCYDQTPSALTFEKSGKAYFGDEKEPIHKRCEKKRQGYDWELKSAAIIVDNGAVFSARDDLDELLATSNVEVLCFDPLAWLTNAHALRQQAKLQYFPGVILGDGQRVPASELLNRDEKLMDAFSCPSASAPADYIPSVALDSVNGLESIDYFQVGEVGDSLTILQHAERSVTDALVVQVRVTFPPTCKRQADFASVQEWLNEHGFLFYCFRNERYKNDPSYYPVGVNFRATKLQSAEAVFLPNDDRVVLLTDDQKTKLAFLLHSVYGIRDKAAGLLAMVDTEKAEKYLIEQEVTEELEIEKAKWLKPGTASADGGSSPFQSQSRFVHVFFNNKNAQAVVDLLSSNDIAMDSYQEVVISSARSMPDYDVDISKHKNAQYFDPKTQLNEVRTKCLQPGVEGVLFHGLFFEWQKKLLDEVGAKKKVVWVIWGGDLYNPIKKEDPIYRSVAKLSGVAADIDGDYDLFEQTYGSLPRIRFRYPTSNSYWSMPLPDEKENLLFVGNSGDPSNNHFDLLEWLCKKQDIFGYNIVIPFSYNASNSYLARVKRHATALGLSDNIYFIEKMLDTASYFRWLSRAQMNVMAHHRQQGISNILASIYFGSSVVIRKYIRTDNVSFRINPLWKELKVDIGASIIDFDDSKEVKTVADLAAPGVADLDTVRERLQAVYGQSGVIKEALKGFEEIRSLKQVLRC